MYLLSAVCSIIGLAVVCIAVAALILAAGHNLTCVAERGEPDLVLIVCQSPVFP